MQTVKSLNIEVKDDEMTIEEEFKNIHVDDLWVYNKLQLSKKLNYQCGPVGMNVPSPGFYIVRPCVNFMGMGQNAQILHLESSTDHLNSAYFWSEIFQGKHLSIDYHHQKPVLSVRGYRNSKNSLSKWNSWVRTDDTIEFPSILTHLAGNYEWINCEFIDSKLIEVHFRRNEDFRFGNHLAIPVWNDDQPRNYSNMTYVEDKDYKRLGFWIQ